MFNLLALASLLPNMQSATRTKDGHKKLYPSKKAKRHAMYQERELRRSVARNFIPKMQSYFGTIGAI